MKRQYWFGLKRMKLSRILLYVLFFFSFLTAWEVFSHAYLPYVYNFEYSEGVNYGRRKMVVRFEHYGVGIDENLITVEPLDPTAFVTLKPTIKDLKLITGNLHVKFGNFDRDILEYKLIIKPGGVRYAGDYKQLDTFEMPFKMHDIETGFRSTFIEPIEREVAINQILKNNAPRDIQIVVPTLYVNQIRTIHKYEGLLPEERRSPNLTNIDIEALDDVARVDLTVTGPFMGVLDRKLERHSEGVFTTGQAGLGAEGFMEGQHEIEIVAMDEFGRNLEEKKFKLKVNDAQNDFTRDDYVDNEEVAEIFGQTYSLLNLMEDGALLESIISKMRVEELDRIGVYYPRIDQWRDVGNSVNALAQALATNDVQIIRLGDNISVSQPLEILRDVLIEGFGRSIIGFPEAEVGSDRVKLGNGMEDIDVTLRNLSINGSLDIDVGTRGNAHLKGVNIAGETVLKSAGTASVIFEDFSTTLMTIENNFAPVRIVYRGNTNVTTTIVKGVQPIEMVNETQNFGKVRLETGEDIMYSGDIDLEFVNGYQPKVQRYGFDIGFYRERLGEFIESDEPVTGENFNVGIKAARNKDYNLLSGKRNVKITTNNTQEGYQGSLFNDTVTFKDGEAKINISLDITGVQVLTVQIEDIDFNESANVLVVPELQVNTSTSLSDLTLMTVADPFNALSTDAQDHKVTILVPSGGLIEKLEPWMVDLTQMPESIELEMIENWNGRLHMTFKEVNTDQPIEAQSFDIVLRHELVAGANKDSEPITITIERPE